MGKNKIIKFDEDESGAGTSEVDGANEKEHATEKAVVGEDEREREESSKRKRVRKHSKKEKKEKEVHEKRSHIAPSVLSGKSSNKRSAGDDDEEERAKDSGEKKERILGLTAISMNPVDPRSMFFRTS